MEELTGRQVRDALRNCSRGERQSLTLPPLGDVPWADLEYLGWRDPRAPLRGYVVQQTASGARGIALRVPESRVRRTAQCALCRTVHQDGVALFVAPLAGPAGREGNTVGTYVCADLACSLHLRTALRPTRAVPDPAPVLAAQAAELTSRLDAFVDRVLQG